MSHFKGSKPGYLWTADATDLHCCMEEREGMALNKGHGTEENPTKPQLKGSTFVFSTEDAVAVRE